MMSSQIKKTLCPTCFKFLEFQITNLEKFLINHDASKK
jgi:hypothetical protein